MQECPEKQHMSSGSISPTSGWSNSSPQCCHAPHINVDPTTYHAGKWHVSINLDSGINNWPSVTFSSALSCPWKTLGQEIWWPLCYPFPLLILQNVWAKRRAATSPSHANGNCSALCSMLPQSGLSIQIDREPTFSAPLIVKGAKRGMFRKPDIISSLYEWISQQ